MSHMLFVATYVSCKHNNIVCVYIHVYKVYIMYILFLIIYIYLKTSDITWEVCGKVSPLTVCIYSFEVSGQVA